MVHRAATSLHDQIGLRREGWLATILFNQDITVMLYFAAWISGITVVPITPTLRREFQRLRALDGVTRIQGLVFHKSGEKLSHTYREVQRCARNERLKTLCSTTSAIVPWRT